eukprot:1195966-Prorocentrum_minimum.AAC.8
MSGLYTNRASVCFANRSSRVSEIRSESLRKKNELSPTVLLIRATARARGDVSVHKCERPPSPGGSGSPCWPLPAPPWSPPAPPGGGRARSAGPPIECAAARGPPPAVGLSPLPRAPSAGRRGGGSTSEFAETKQIDQ